ncbi:hypothetical protein TI03_00665 [Achromatium sp. WMS1]|nr:hypothetical protein TI03_00665 [Achromatium sp. WMS1]
MKMIDGNINITDRRIYNIALYGLSNSGKTCLLAALAMDRHSNPSGFSATWLTSSTQTGKEWLQEAINALENNQVPPPTPNTNKHITFDFMFSYKGQRYQVRMFDYSGELVSPDASDTANAESLRTALVDMDALLILAPVFHSRDNRQLSKNLNDLNRTFASLAIQREENINKLPRLPVALIFNMWDRRSNLIHENPETEWRDLEKYLQLDQAILPKPIPHRRLYDNLQSGWNKNLLTTYQSGDLWRRFRDFRDMKPINCDLMPFPLSAFGEYVTVCNDDGTSFERPKEINPLHSFGLEDPFIWALFRRQEIEAEIKEQEDTATLEYLTSEATKLGDTSSRWTFLKLFTIRKLFIQAKRLRNSLKGQRIIEQRYSDSGAQAKRAQYRLEAKNVYIKLRNAWIKQAITATIITISVIGVSIVATEFVLDSWKMANVQSILDNNTSTQKELQQAEAWQDAFAHSPIWQHTLYATLQKTKAQLAEELQTARTKRRLVLDSADWEQAKQVNTEESITSYIRKYPLGQHIKAAHQALGYIIKAKSWQQYKANYNEHLRNGEVLEAAKLLENPSVTQHVEELHIKAAFPEIAMGLLTTKIAEWQKQHKWTDAINYLQQIMQIPADIWPVEQRNSIVNKLTTEINQSWDRALYKTACDFRTQNKMHDYIAQAPLKTMRAYIEKYLEYLNQQSGINNFQLVLTRVEWNENVHSKTSATFHLNVNGKKIDSPKIDGPRFAKIAHLNLPIDFMAKYTDSILIKLEIVGDGWVGERLLGKAEKTVTLQNILRGTELILKNNEHETGRAFLRLTVKTEAEPTLPTWKTQ